MSGDIMDCHTLCIEADPTYFSILQLNVVNVGKFDNVHPVLCCVGDQSGSLNGKLQSEGGTARITTDNCLGDALDARALPDILRDESLFEGSKLLKIDTDGLDCRILLGSMVYIERVKPVLFFEYDPFLLGQDESDGLDVFRTLRAAGYRMAIIYENNGDYLLSAELNNQILLQDIRAFFSGRKGQRYCDICILHEEDTDVWRSIRSAELEFFRHERCGPA